MSLTIDKEFKDLIPPLTDDEYTQLEKNCVRDGIRDSLVAWKSPDGKEILIDGHNRYEIAKHHSLKTEVKYMEFPNRTSVKNWIITNQLGRRNLPAAARILLAKKMEPVFKAEGKVNQGTRTDIKPKEEQTQANDEKKITLGPNGPEVRHGDTKEKIAKLAGVSEGTITRFDYVQKHGTPEVKKQMEQSKISINSAYKKTRPDPVTKAKQEHEQFQEQKKTQQVVSFEEAKDDKVNQDIACRDLYLRILKCGNAIDAISFSIKDSQIKEMARVRGHEDCKHLCTMIDKWTEGLESIKKSIMEGDK